MNGKTAKVTLAIALGVLIGAAAATELQKIHGLLAWFAPLIGGLAGYFSYDFQTVRKAIPRAWNSVSSWQPDWEEIKATTKFIIKAATLVIPGGVSLAASAFIGASLLILSLGNNIWPVIGITPIFIFLSILGSLITATAVIPTTLEGEYESRRKKQERYLKNALKFCLNANTIAVFIYWPIRGLIWAVIRIPKAIKTTSRNVGIFAKTLFLLIHSERRFIVGLWALAGTVAFLGGIPLWLSLAGGVLGGIVSVELVSKRWLKTLPAYNGA